MKREDLAALGLDKEAIDKIMDLHKTDVEAWNTKITTKDSDLKLKDTKILELSNTVKSFEGVDVEKLKSDVKTWETKYETDLKQAKLDNAISLAIITSKPKDTNLVKTLIATDKLILNDDGSVLGLKEQLETIKKDKAYLFEEEKPLDVDLGGEHGGGDQNKQPETIEAAINDYYSPKNNE